MKASSVSTKGLEDIPTGAVDEDLDGAEFGAGALDGRGDGSRIADIEFDGEAADFRSDAFGAFRPRSATATRQPAAASERQMAPPMPPPPPVTNAIRLPSMRSLPSPG
jgi:hypothetical protein